MGRANGKAVLKSKMLWANRNAFFYVLDRATGNSCLGKPFVKQPHRTSGLDEAGRANGATEYGAEHRKV